MNLQDRLLSATVAGLEQSLERYAPGSLYSKFCSWCFRKPNPQRKLLIQVLGINQLTNLTLKLFEGLLSEQEWEVLLPYCATLNTYLTCEAVSDNVAIGLARPQAEDATARDRRQVVMAFNTVTIERLEQKKQSAQAELSSMEAVTRQISMFKSSLSPKKLLYLAAAAVKQNQNWSIREINASLQAMLVANAETCHEVAQTLGTWAGADLVRQGLIDRYQAVNTLLENQPLSREQRVDVGTDAILVAPTIGYYLTVLAHKVRPLPGFEALVTDGSLETALYDAALLVRLLNDLGTPVLQMSGIQRRQLIEQMEQMEADRHQWNLPPTHSFLDILAKFTETCVELTRIRKDTMFGEYNLALDRLPSDRSVSETLSYFAESLDYYSELYQRHRERLTELTTQISERLQDGLISQVILRFVYFHEQLYSNAFGSQTGEYAI